MNTSQVPFWFFTLPGIGFHHSGMAFADRRLVEGLFERSEIMILCATTTLAQVFMEKTTVLELHLLNLNFQAALLGF